MDMNDVKPEISSFIPSIFSSKFWMFSWLSIYGRYLNNRSMMLVGEVFLHVNTYRLMKFIPVTSITQAGVHLPASEFVRSEYNSFLNLLSNDEFLKKLKSLHWNQFYIPDVYVDETFLKVLNKATIKLDCNLVVLKEETAYRISSDSFSNYLKALSASTRRRYFTQRHKLAEQADLKVIDYAHKPDEFLILLNKFHRDRWGRNCYSNKDWLFFLLLSKSPDVNLIFSVLFFNDQPVSCLFDVDYRNVRYNFQSGYVVQSPSISLKNVAWGSLHLGMAIEETINNNKFYDLLAGKGKRDNYKEKIATETRLLTTYSMERGLLGCLRLLYRNLKKH